MSLMYVAKRVRPDILFVTCMLATKCETPNATHLKYAMHTVAYLKATKSKGIRFRSGGDNDLHVYADASFSAHPDGSSHTGIVCILGGAPIYFKSTKQRLVVKSTTDAELYACDDGVEIGLWLADLCREIGHDPGDILHVYQDNQAAIVLMTRGSYSRKRGSMRARLGFVRQQIELGLIELIDTESEAMLADVLTKALHGAAFEREAGKLLHSPVFDRMAVQDEVVKTTVDSPTKLTKASGKGTNGYPGRRGRGKAAIASKP